MNKNKGVILGALVLVLVIIIVIAASGVRVSNKSPEGVVKSLITAYQENSEKAIRKCYGFGKKETLDPAVESEMKSTLEFFEAHKAKEVSFKECKSLGTFNGYDLVYVIYEYQISLSDLKEKAKDSAKDETKEEKEKNKLKAPAISFYFTKNVDEKYYVVPAKDVTTEMSDISKDEYSRFIKTDVYKEYQESYNTFIKEHPTYEELLTKSLKKIKDGTI